MQTRMPATSDRYAGNQLFALGIEQAQLALSQRPMTKQCAVAGARGAPGVMERARGYARQHPVTALGTAMVAAYLVNRVFRSR